MSDATREHANSAATGPSAPRRARWAVLRRWFAPATLVLGVAFCTLALGRLLQQQVIVPKWRPLPALGAVAGGSASLLFSVAAWRAYLAAAARTRLPFGAAFAQVGVAMVGKYVPGKVSGIIARVTSNAGRASAGAVLLATALEQLVAIACAGLVGALFYAGASGFGLAAAGAGLAALALWAFPSTLAAGIDFLARHWKALRPLASGHAPLDLEQARRGIVFSALQWVALVAMAMATTGLVVPDASLAVIALAAGSYGLAVGAGMISFVFPGGIGPREAAFVFLCSGAIAAPDALAIALALRVGTTLIDIAAGLGYLFGPGVAADGNDAMSLRQRLLNLLGNFGFEGSAEYWNTRYRRGGTSGAGSFGGDARYKTEFLNALIERHGIDAVVDFGCGDGNQLEGLRVARYLGFDVSPAAVELCRARYANDAGKSFRTIDTYAGERAPAAFSLDVIYHLVEDAVFLEYLDRLFGAGERLVVVYSSNVEDRRVLRARHVRHRCVTAAVAARHPEFELIEQPPRPPELGGPAPQSASFFVFRRRD